MKRKKADAEATMESAFRVPSIGKLSWMGLIVASLGWGLLLGEATMTDILVTKMPRPATFHADLVEIAQCIIGSGFALAIIGALQTGFGALNRFFEAALARSAQRHAAPEQPVDDADIVEQSARETSKTKPYCILPDGSVEVETIVGTRRFESFEEARDFL